MRKLRLDDIILRYCILFQSQRVHFPGLLHIWIINRAGMFMIEESWMLLRVLRIVCILPRMRLICYQRSISTPWTSQINGCVTISKIAKSEWHTIQSTLIPIIVICVHGFGRVNGKLDMDWTGSTNQQFYGKFESSDWNIFSFDSIRISISPTSANWSQCTGKSLSHPFSIWTLRWLDWMIPRYLSKTFDNWSWFWLWFWPFDIGRIFTNSREAASCSYLSIRTVRG
jgi:hypothetical protein